MAKKTTDKKTDAETDQALRDRLEIIRRKQGDIDKAAVIVGDLKADLKTAKDSWEGKVVDLGEFIRGEGPLFEESQSAVSDQPSAKEETD